MDEHSIILYTGQTPNGIKISIMLEELGLPYTVRKVDMLQDEKKSDWFREINPNGRIPAPVERFDDGKDIQVFESGSIMQYLLKYDHDYTISYEDDELVVFPECWYWTHATPGGSFPSIFT